MQISCGLSSPTIQDANAPPVQVFTLFATARYAHHASIVPGIVSSLFPSMTLRRTVLADPALAPFILSSMRRKREMARMSAVVGRLSSSTLTILSPQMHWPANSPPSQHFATYERTGSNLDKMGQGIVTQ